MERSETMVTLIPVRGKEIELKNMLDRFGIILETQGARIIKGETKTIHYHVIGENINQIIKKIKKWPGIKIKIHKVSKSQAQEMKQGHVLCCYSIDGGLQHEGSNSTYRKETTMNKTFEKLDGLDAKTRETLEKQMQLLSERSTEASNADLANLTYAMTDIARMLRARVHTGSQPDISTGESAWPSSKSQSEHPVA